VEKTTLFSTNTLLNNKYYLFNIFSPLHRGVFVFVPVCKKSVFSFDNYFSLTDSEKGFILKGKGADLFEAYDFSL
jgi:hypothetical protein